MRRLACCFMVSLAVAGCGQKSGIEDLREFTEEAYKNQKPAVEPLPALRPTSVFVYTASDQTDPFSKLNLRLQEDEPEDLGGGEEHAPDPTRKQEPLEAHPIDQLKLVGIINQDGVDWAIVEAPDQTVHRVTKGNYLGQNHGEIIAVRDRQVQIEQRVQNEVGRWEREPASLVLGD